MNSANDVTIHGYPWEPGPWVWTGQQLWGNGHRVIDTRVFPDDMAHSANGRLIALAPEMAELLTRLDAVRIGPFPARELAALREEARELLVRMTGEA